MPWKTGRLLLLCLGLCLCLFSGTVQGTFATDEDALRTALFTGYNTKVRPESQTNITIGIAVSSLNRMDIADQTMSVTVIFSLFWIDSRLVWDNATHGGINTLVTAPEDVWTPPIVIENAAKDVGVLGGKDRDATPLRIRSNGVIIWVPPTDTTTSCEMSIAYYPFDTQECSIVLMGWTYPISEVYVFAGGIDTETLYNPNGEFDLLTATSHERILKDEGIPDFYSKLNYKFTFRRKWHFYGQNLLMPIVLNSILMNIVFLLPIESGEKMGYSLTVLLSYIVFLTWVTENLPPVSTDTSILQIYLAIVLCLGVLATMLTMWVLHLHHTAESEPMNFSYRKFTNLVLEPFSNFVKRKKNKKSNVHEIAGHPKLAFGKIAPSSTLCKSPKMSLSQTSSESEDQREKKRVGVDGFEKRVECDDDVHEYSWQELAVLYDTFFFYMFALVLFLVTLVVFAMLYAQY